MVVFTFIDLHTISNFIIVTAAVVITMELNFSPHRVSNAIYRYCA